MQKKHIDFPIGEIAVTVVVGVITSILVTKILETITLNKIEKKYRMIVQDLEERYGRYE
jgi:hypothetical protein